jgi:hypothetical protein
MTVLLAPYCKLSPRELQSLTMTRQSHCEPSRVGEPKDKFSLQVIEACSPVVVSEASAAARFGLRSAGNRVGVRIRPARRLVEIGLIDREFKNSDLVRLEHRMGTGKLTQDLRWAEPQAL